MSHAVHHDHIDYCVCLCLINYIKAELFCTKSFDCMDWEAFHFSNIYVSLVSLKTFDNFFECAWYVQYNTMAHQCKVRQWIH